MPKKRKQPQTTVRRVAFNALRRVELESAYSSFLTSFAAFQGLTPRNRALAHELVFGVLRRKSTLDWVIREYRSGVDQELETEIAIILRMGTYQMLFMSRVPHYAAITESVDLCRHCVGHKATGLVNAILRRISSECEMWQGRLHQEYTEEEDQARVYSHPLWLWRRWVSRFDLETVKRVASANNRPPRADLHLVFPTESDRGEIARLCAEGHLHESQLLSGCYRSSTSTLPSPLELEKFVYYQAFASQCIAELLPICQGETVFDFCAAPGGKAIRLAQRVGRRGRVIAMDRHYHRLSIMKEQMNRFGVENILCFVGDGEGSVPVRQSWQCVLLDAPCSGLGTLRRNPEIRWRVCEKDLMRLQKLQIKLLRNAARSLRRGGTLLYSTCSTEPEENEQVLSKFLSLQTDFRLIPIVRQDPLRAFIDGDGLFKTFPSYPEEDGFFAALLRKVG